MSKAKTALLAIIALGAGLAVSAQDVMHARVSHDAGAMLIQGREESEWSNAPMNTLVLAGDQLWVDQNGTAEIEFPGGTFLRLADASKAEMTSIMPTAAIRLWHGSFYVHRAARSSGDVVVTAPAATIEVQSDSNVRIDVAADGGTVVSVRFGLARVRTDHGGAVDAGAGSRVFVDPGLLPSEAVPFNTSQEDAFDAWNRERVKLLVQGVSAVPSSVPISTTTLGYSTLASSGEWVYIDNRQYWRPTIVASYVPYRHGYWSYVPAYGHVWVGHYGFSYVTSHYGRWGHFPGYGWCWSYDPIWSPAWVASVRVGPYHVWSPIDYYNRPILWGAGGYFNVGGLRFSYGASSYVSGAYLYHGPGYAAPLYGTNITTVYANDIHIWNIYTGGRYSQDRYRVPYRADSPLTVRDYAPSRSIRGPSVYGPSERSAGERARVLEARAGRDRFSPVEASSRRDVRTAVSERSRDMGVRSVSRIEDVPRDRLLSASEERARTVRSARMDIDSTTPAVSPRQRTTTPPGRGTASPHTPGEPGRGTPSVSAPSTTRTTPQRSAPSVSAPSTTRTTPQRSAPSVSAPSSTRTTPQRSAPSVSAPSTTRTTPQRTAPSVSAPSTTRTTPQRTAPSVSAPSTTRTTPQRSAPSVSAPSSTRTTPQRSAPAPSRSYSAPTRSAPAPSPAPSRSYSAPTRSAPAPSPAPSRSYSAPAPSRSYSAPAPSPAPSRSYSAPAPSRSYSAPSSSRSAPSAAPSRGAPSSSRGGRR